MHMYTCVHMKAKGNLVFSNVVLGRAGQGSQIMFF